MATNAPTPSPSSAPAATPRPQSKSFVVKSKRNGKRASDGQLKLGIWFKNHKFGKMFYIYSPSRFNNYDRELRHLVGKVDGSYKKWAGKIESADIFNVGDTTSGPRVLAYRRGEFMSDAEATRHDDNRG